MSVEKVKFGTKGIEVTGKTAATKFRLAATNLFLTYKGHINHQVYIKWFEATTKKTILKYIFTHEIGFEDRIALLQKQEPGFNDNKDDKEGFWHTHVLLCLETKLQTTKPRLLDIPMMYKDEVMVSADDKYYKLEHKNSFIHGDYMKVKSVKASFQYCMKGDIKMQESITKCMDWNKRHAKKKGEDGELKYLYKELAPRHDAVYWTKGFNELNNVREINKVQLIAHLRTCKTIEEALETPECKTLGDTTQVVNLWNGLKNEDFSRGYHVERAEKMVLRSWQEDLYKQICQDVDDDRKIIWVHDKVGKSGKSSLATYIEFGDDEKLKDKLTSDFPDIARVSDLAQALKSDCGEKGQCPDIVTIDLSRARNESGALYIFMEQMKNGKVFSAKYKSGRILVRPALIIVFANFYPTVSKSSTDRWDIKNVYFSEDKDDYVMENILLEDLTRLIMENDILDGLEMDAKYDQLLADKKMMIKNISAKTTQTKERIIMRTEARFEKERKKLQLEYSYLDL